jgi:hypothetical protein
MMGKAVSESLVRPSRDGRLNPAVNRLGGANVAVRPPSEEGLMDVAGAEEEGLMDVAGAEWDTRSHA